MRRPRFGPMAHQPAHSRKATVAQGDLAREAAQNKPPEVTAALLARGQDRFNAYCSPCHGLSGYGDGMVVQRGFPPPPSYHSDGLRQIDGQFFVNVQTQGFGVMYPYADRVSVEDRWAIAAYIRALQLSQYASVAVAPKPGRSSDDFGSRSRPGTGACVSRKARSPRCSSRRVRRPLPFSLSMPEAAAAAGSCAFVLFSQMALGSMALLLIHNLVHVRWGVHFGRLLKALVLGVPLLAILWIPIAIHLGALYPWALPAQVPPDVHAAYLNPASFALRSIVALAGWVLFAVLLLINGTSRG